MALPSHFSPPKLCNLVKWTTFQGYGFNLHAEKGKAGQFIGKVDPGSPADLGGLKPNDILIEVNSVNVEHFKHQQVVECVKSRSDSVSLLVCNAETLNYCRENQISINTSLPELVEISTPDQQPIDNLDGLEQNGDGESNPEQIIPAIADEQREQQQQQPSENKQETTSHNQNNDTTPDVSQDSNISQKSSESHQQQQNDPLANISLAEMRAKIGQNRRNQAKLTPSTFTEKQQVFQSL